MHNYIQFPFIFVCEINAFTIIIHNVKIECIHELHSFSMNAFIPNPDNIIFI